MATEIEKIFTAVPRSTSQFLCENGQGCYIPAYQRFYSWDNENIARLFEDVLNGLLQLKARPNTISFLGTIISIHDTRYRTIEPLFRPDVAPRVMTIIDGQQRICTLVMSNIALHNHIRKALSMLNGKNEAHLSWIYDQSIQMLENLKMTCLIDMISGDGNYRFYPRVIRAYADAWSRREGQARYESDIAKLVWDFIHFNKSESEGQFKFQPVNSSGEVPSHYRKIQGAFTFIHKEIQRICESRKPRDFDFLLYPITATQETEVAEAIWGFEPPNEVKKYVAEASQDVSYNRFCNLLRYLIFARYLNHRVAITNVMTENEDDAFDMFESLNTTGEPLTAFETLKPKVINMETLERYKTSDSFKHISEIERYLNKDRSAEEKQRTTSEMLVAFALAETGYKLQQRLNHQRRYLRDQFESLVGSDDKEQGRQFVRSMAAIASFMDNGWNVGRGNSPSFAPLIIDDRVYDECAFVGFDALRKLRHSITIAPLSRFYQVALDATTDLERSSRTAAFISAIKATVAFSFLWRGAMGGTKNIDSHYRDIMRAGSSLDGENISPLSRRPNGGRTSIVSIANYKKALWRLLKREGIESKEGWVNRISTTDVYQSATVIARFLLFCATDDAIPHSTEPGLIERGREGLSPMLMLDRWNDEKYFTVEHVAPHSRSNGWEADIYSDHRNIHLLGNLILLPSDVNNIVGNRGWRHKRLIYRLLAAKTQTEFDKISSGLDAEGLVLGKKPAEVLEKSKYLGICKSVGDFEDTWSLKVIKERTRCLAALAWERLAPWLSSEEL